LDEWAGLVSTLQKYVKDMTSKQTATLNERFDSMKMENTHLQKKVDNLD
jgi:hypothetical protein